MSPTRPRNTLPVVDHLVLYIEWASGGDHSAKWSNQTETKKKKKKGDEWVIEKYVSLFKYNKHMFLSYD